MCHVCQRHELMTVQHLVVVNGPICCRILQQDATGILVDIKVIFVPNNDIEAQAICARLADCNGLGMTLVLQQHAANWHALLQ